MTSLHSGAFWYCWRRGTGSCSTNPIWRAPLGISAPGIGRWLDILEITGQILLVPPWFENLGKRLVKSPKLYIADAGLACHLLGISSAVELDKSPFLGALFEGFIAAELVKAQLNAGRRRELYYFRDQQGLEVDFIVPGVSGAVQLVEAKATATPTPGMATPMRRLAGAFNKRDGVPRQVSMSRVYRPSRSSNESHAILPGVKALPWQEFVVADSRIGRATPRPGRRPPRDRVTKR